jgi:hypothetical protein
MPRLHRFHDPFAMDDMPSPAAQGCVTGGLRQPLDPDPDWQPV